MFKITKTPHENVKSVATIYFVRLLLTLVLNIFQYIWRIVNKYDCYTVSSTL